MMDKYQFLKGWECGPSSLPPFAAAQGILYALPEACDGHGAFLFHALDAIGEFMLVDFWKIDRISHLPLT
jgi:hypothetical protein